VEPERTGEGTWALRWGPFEFGDLKPGVYKAQVVWRSSQDELTDPDRGESGHVPGVWKGTVNSNVVELQLRQP
jgi:hypothetical protein